MQTYQFFAPNGSKFTDVDPDVVLSYRIASQQLAEGTPALSRDCTVTKVPSGWKLEFSLVDEAILPYLPMDTVDNDTEWSMGVKQDDDGDIVLAQVILPLPQSSVDAIEKILCVPVVSTFALCKDSSKKICCNCKTGCGDEPVKKGLPVKDELLATLTSAYAKATGTSYEKSLYQVMGLGRLIKKENK